MVFFFSLFFLVCDRDRVKPGVLGRPVLYEKGYVSCPPNGVCNRLHTFLYHVGAASAQWSRFRLFIYSRLTVYLSSS